MRRRGIIGSGIFLVVLFFAVGTAGAGCIGEITGTDYGCGDTVIESCTFNENLTCPGGGLIIGADGITIDGNGFTLSGTTVTSPKEGIHNEVCDDVTIKDLNIVDFCFGIYFTGVNNCSTTNNRISYGVGSGIWLHSSLYNEIIGNRVYHGDEGHGILLSSSANNNTIEYNDITTSNGMGISIDESNGNELYHNYICSNRRGDIVVTGSMNRGDNNTCGMADNYNDTNTMGCTHSCTFMDPTDERPMVAECCDRRCGCISNTNASKIFACGDTVTESCTFNCDLECKKGHGLIIGADNVTIDGDGHTLDGFLAGVCNLDERPGIYNKGYEDLTVKNLEIKNFCNGIYLEGNIREVIHRNTIDGCNIHHNGNDKGGDTQTHGIKMRYVYNSTISSNKIHHNLGRGDSCENGGNGIFLYAGDYNIITNNTVYGNTKAGIFTKMKPKYNTISSNTVTENGQGGIVLRCKLSSLFIIENNIVSDNKGVGIYVGGAGNTLKDNTVTNNRNGSAYGWDGMGIWMDREAYNTTLISNNVTGNDYADIKVKEGLTGTEGYNNTYEKPSNYEGNFEESEIVEGKRVECEWSERSNHTAPERSGLPSVNITPLMATLLVFFVLILIFYGYLRGNNR